MTKTLTKRAHAQAEIDRRALPKSDPARKHVGGDVDAPLAGHATTPAFGLSGAELAAQVAPRAKATAAKVRKAPATKIDPLEHVRVLANEEFRVAKEAGGVKAGFAARKAFCEALKTLAG